MFDDPATDRSITFQPVDCGINLAFNPTCTHPLGHSYLSHFPAFAESKNPFLSASAFETYRRPFIYAEKRFRGYRPRAVTIRQMGHVPPFDRSNILLYIRPNLDLCNAHNKMNDSMQNVNSSEFERKCDFWRSFNVSLCNPVLWRLHKSEEERTFARDERDTFLITTGTFLKTANNRDSYDPRPYIIRSETVAKAQKSSQWGARGTPARLTIPFLCTEYYYIYKKGHRQSDKTSRPSGFLDSVGKLF